MAFMQVRALAELSHNPWHMLDCLFFYTAQAIFKHFYFNFFITGEESSKSTKHANKMRITIFMIMKATNLDKQSNFGNLANLN